METKNESKGVNISEWSRQIIVLLILMRPFNPLHKSWQWNRHWLVNFIYTRVPANKFAACALVPPTIKGSEISYCLFLKAK